MTDSLEQRPGESRQEWKDRTFYQRYSVGQEAMDNFMKQASATDDVTIECPEGFVQLQDSCVEIQPQEPAVTSLPEEFQKPPRMFGVEGFEEGSTTFIASFGFGQIHADGYVKIQADTSDEAYTWMSERYSQRWSSLYGETRGMECVIQYGWQMICNVDIRSGHDPIIEPIHEFLWPKEMKLLGEIQPILKAEDALYIYYHYGIEFSAKLEEAKTVVEWCEKNHRKISGVWLDVSIFGGYSRFYWDQDS